MNITKLEQELINTIAYNEYGDDITDPKWFWSVSDDFGHVAQISGVVSSLKKKGLVDVDSQHSKYEHVIWLTDAGAELAVYEYE